MYLLTTEFDCPEMALCGLRDVKIQLLTNNIAIKASALLAVTETWLVVDYTFQHVPRHRLIGLVIETQTLMTISN